MDFGLPITDPPSHVAKAQHLDAGHRRDDVRLLRAPQRELHRSARRRMLELAGPAEACEREGTPPDAMVP